MRLGQFWTCDKVYVILIMRSHCQKDSVVKLIPSIKLISSKIVTLFEAHHHVHYALLVQVARNS